MGENPRRRRRRGGAADHPPVDRTGEAIAAPAPIVVLNGAPRSGKSSIAAALAADSSRIWLNLGVDAFMAATPEHLRPGIGLRPGGERPDLEAAVAALYAALFEAIAAASRSGLAVVADLGIHDGYARPLGIWEAMQGSLSGLPLLTVGVVCPLATIMARRNADPQSGFYAAGETVPPPVARWQAAVHEGHAYDLKLDTAVLTPAECAERIARALAEAPAVRRSEGLTRA